MFYGLGIYGILDQYPLLAGTDMDARVHVCILFCPFQLGQRGTAMLFSSVEIDGRSFLPMDFTIFGYHMTLLWS